MGRKGFTCPRCGEPLVVIKTRRRATNVVARRRKCKTCGHRMTTKERPEAA